MDKAIGHLIQYELEGLRRVALMERAEVSMEPLDVTARTASAIGRFAHKVECQLLFIRPDMTPEYAQTMNETVVHMFLISRLLDIKPDFSLPEDTGLFDEFMNEYASHVMATGMVLESMLENERESLRWMMTEPEGSLEDIRELIAIVDRSILYSREGNPVPPLPEGPER